MNPLSNPLKQKLINSPIPDFSLWCGIFGYRKEKSNLKIEVALVFEFILFIMPMTL